MSRRDTLPIILTIFLGATLLFAGWTKLPEWQNVPTKPDLKNIKSGGLILTDGAKIYILKGNNTKSFYSWIPGDTVRYYDSVRVTGKKGVKKGTGMVYDGTKYIYFVPGTNTKQFWKYDLTAKQWDTLPPVRGDKKLKGGTGIAYANGNIYLLKGSKTREFLCYNGTTWDTLPSAPAKANPEKGYGDGSCIVYDGSDYIYALRGKYNEFYRYSISGNAWETESIMPFIHPMVKKEKKVGEGAAMVLKDGNIYAFKGNNTKEFWRYEISSGKWTGVETIPKGSEKKYVKGGGGLCLFNDTIYAIKGNNQNVIYKFDFPSAPKFGPTGNITGKRSSALIIRPNPTRDFFTVYYNLPLKDWATLKIYNVLGNTVYSARSDKGQFTIRKKLPSGIYLLRFSANGYKEDKKLIVTK